MYHGGINANKGYRFGKSLQVIAAVELGKRIALTTNVNNYKIQGPEDISNLLMEEMRYLNKEIFNIILLNTKNNVIAIENISIGSLNASIVPSRRRGV